MKNGVMYSAEGDGSMAYIVASDVQIGKELWRAKAFHVHINPFYVQSVFISELKFSESNLLVRDERSRCYVLDLAKHRVHKDSCSKYFSPPAAH